MLCRPRIDLNAEVFPGSLNFVRNSFQILRPSQVHCGIKLAMFERKWTESEEKVFREVQSGLTRAPVMAYFTPRIPTCIVTDASPLGLGAILEQKQSDGEYRLVYYASRKLTDTESRYSQFEREAL